MKPPKLVLHLHAEREGDQWTVMCLEFSLAAQADTIEEARARVVAQIESFIEDITVGPLREHAEDLLNHSRAPFKYWVRYGKARAAAWLDRLFDGKRRPERSGEISLPMTVAHLS